MTIQVTIEREINGARATFIGNADTKEAADLLAQFLAGVTNLPASASVPGATAKPEVKKEPTAKKAQLSGSDSTKPSQTEAVDTSKPSEPEPNPPSVEQEKAAGKTYTRDTISQLVLDIVKKHGKETALAVLQRNGVTPPLAKDCDDQALLSAIGAMAEATLAGTYNPLEG
jgi:hypothetical protein